MNDNPNVVPKETVAKMLTKILEIYNSDDERRKEDFFERELPMLIQSGDFSYNPREDN
jgi:hypothetical protein